MLQSLKFIDSIECSCAAKLFLVQQKQSKVAPAMFRSLTLKRCSSPLCCSRTATHPALVHIGGTSRELNQHKPSYKHDFKNK